MWDGLLYHWTSVKKAKQTLETNTLRQEKHFYYLENPERACFGTIWTLDSFSWHTDPQAICQDHNRWYTNNPVCFAIRANRISNTIYGMNGARAYMLAQCLTGHTFHPREYLKYSQDPNEKLILGNIENLTKSLIEIQIPFCYSRLFSKFDVDWQVTVK